MTLGKRIAELRKNKNITQESLAEMMDVSPQAVSKWENDISCPDINSLPRLSEVLDCSLDFLLGKNTMPAAYIPQVKKDPSLKLLKIRISDDGDKIAVNIPFEIVKIFMEKGNINDYIGTSKNEKVKEINWQQVTELIDAGVMGKLVAIEDEDGAKVEIFVE